MREADTGAAGRRRRARLIFAAALALLALKGGTAELKGVVRNAFGRLGQEEATFIPEMERPKVYREARIWLGIWAAVILLSLATHSFLPLMLVGLPSFYGAWFYLFTGLTQHIGLAEDVLDHRLNSRTVMMNPVLRFLYWNIRVHASAGRAADR